MITVTKKEFRLIESMAYGNCPFITQGNEEQVNFHSSLINHELKLKYNIINN